MTLPGGPHGPGSGPGDVRNLIIAVALSAAILIGFQVFYFGPQQRAAMVERARIEEQIQRENVGAPSTPAVRDREQALADTAARRVPLDTPSVDGSILLQGARFDDLNLKRYRQSVDPESPEVTLLSPRESRHGYDAFLGWEERHPRLTAQGECENFCGVGASDMWTAAENAALAPDAPLVLSFETGDGLQVTRTISVDHNYMFTVTDEVRNATDAPREVRPFGVIRRRGLPQDMRQNANVHQGFAGAFGPQQTLHTETYKQAERHARRRVQGRVGEDERLVEEQGQGGWLGITDHYWLAALAPDQSETISAYYDAQQEDDYVDFRAAYRGQWRSVPAGGSVTYTQRVFAGAKSVDLLQAYQEALDIPKFDDAVDWGDLMWPLTRPYFLWLLHPLAKFAGDFAWGILLSTIVIKLLLFPLVYQSYKSMARMRALQPKMKEVQERYAADKARQQQEIMRLFQTEKVNPVSGCLPMLLTIPVFFALYKVLSVTIEMRHAPFFGSWVRDLSAPDPTTIFNLFGLLPYDPSTLPLIGGFLMLGVWPILYGVSMWALQALSPPPTDPVQAQIFRLLPIVFTFIFASFPAGLVIYWTWSNVLTILQQYVIMRRQGVETQLDVFLKKRLKQGAAAAE